VDFAHYLVLEMMCYYRAWSLVRLLQFN